MIDYKKALAKTNGKNETRFGLSIIVDLSKNIEIKSCVQNIKNNMPDNCRKWFFWTENNYHLTLLRCKSTYVDFNIPTDTIEFIKNIFKDKSTFSIPAVTLRLDIDGVIRLYFNHIPPCFYENIDTSSLSTITGLKYQLINNPWVTIAYAVPEFVGNIADNYSNISECLQEKMINLLLKVDFVTLIKYNDNAFRTTNIVSNIALTRRVI